MFKKKNNAKPQQQQKTQPQMVIMFKLTRWKNFPPLFSPLFLNTQCLSTCPGLFRCLKMNVPEDIYSKALSWNRIYFSDSGKGEDSGQSEGEAAKLRCYIQPWERDRLSQSSQLHLLYWKHLSFSMNESGSHGKAVPRFGTWITHLGLCYA